MSDPRGPLTLIIVQLLEETGIPYVYLRNYEKLPEDVGNDVDLLIPRGKQEEATSVISCAASRLGWVLAGKAAFGELALYFVNPATGDSLHIDLYEGFHWRILDFANPDGIFGRRRWNNRVFIPDARDELYLSIAERLIYHGKIRDHHRAAAQLAIIETGRDAVESVFQNHLGPGGRQLAADLIDADWQASTEHRKAMRNLALSKCLKNPTRMLRTVFCFACRLASRLLNPPGKFIVFEGADGVGKSTVMEEIIPWASKWCAGRAPHAFHWKPVRLETWPPKAGPSVDPRAKEPRSTLMSLAFLAYHWTGFWAGWLRQIYPLLAKSHIVAGDRYSYDMFLDPARFRLALPAWICKLAAMTVPRPGIVIGLVASPEKIHARKPELTPQEIAHYQKSWLEFAEGQPNMVTVSADGPVEEVILKVKQAIISHYTA